MLLHPLALVALAGSALATFDIEQDISFSAKDSKQLASMTKAYASQVSKYQASLVTGADWTKAWDVLRAYQQTGKDVPAVVTATNAGTTYATTPAWYNAMPTQAKNVFDGMDKKNRDIAKGIQDDADKNAKSDASARPLGMGLVVGGAVVAAIVGVTVAL